MGPMSSDATSSEGSIDPASDTATPQNDEGATGQVVENVERMCFFTFLQKADEESW